jgi:hypothetical protein
MVGQRGGAQRFFPEPKNKGPRQAPEANADRESPVRGVIMAQGPRMDKSLGAPWCVPLRENWMKVEMGTSTTPKILILRVCLL